MESLGNNQESENDRFFALAEEKKGPVSVKIILNVDNVKNLYSYSIPIPKGARLKYDGGVGSGPAQCTGQLNKDNNWTPPIYYKVYEPGKVFWISDKVEGIEVK